MTWKKVWSHVGSGPLAVHQDRVVANSGIGSHREYLQGLDAATGQPAWRIYGPTAIEAVGAGDVLVALCYKERHAMLYAASVAKGEILWRYVAPEGCGIDAIFAAADDHVVFSTGDGGVVALGLADGREVWRHSVSDLSVELLDGAKAGVVGGVISVDRGNVVVSVSGTYVVSLRLRDGSRQWVWTCGRGFFPGFLYDDRYYLLGTQGGYWVLDALSGKELLSRDLISQTPPSTGVAFITPPILVSDSHFFAGSMQGRLVAFERDTGTFVWSGGPEGGGATGATVSEFAVVAGRLFYIDSGFILHCLEETSRPRTRPAVRRA